MLHHCEQLLELSNASFTRSTADASTRLCELCSLENAQIGKTVLPVANLMAYSKPGTPISYSRFIVIGLSISPHLGDIRCDKDGRRSGRTDNADHYSSWPSHCGEPANKFSAQLSFLSTCASRRDAVSRMTMNCAFTFKLRILKTSRCWTQLPTTTYFASRPFSLDVGDIMSLFCAEVMQQAVAAFRNDVALATRSCMTSAVSARM